MIYYHVLSPEGLACGSVSKESGFYVLRFGRASESCRSLTTVKSKLPAGYSLKRAAYGVSETRKGERRRQAWASRGFR